MRPRVALVIGVIGAAACGDGAVPPAVTTPPPVATSAAQADPLGPRPEIAPSKPFEPPAPQVFKTANGITIWLLERHALPLVSVMLIVPSGSAADPKDLPGLAYVTADMLDEGAGKRNAVEVSTGITDLGAQLSTSASRDGSAVALSVLKKNFRPAFEILSDVAARPRFDAKEWKRVSDLWKGALKKRADDPASVARVVSHAVVYGPDTPYGHPSEGLVAAAPKVDLAKVKAFHASHWRPDRTTMVVVGDVTKAELVQAVDGSLASWKAPPAPAPAPVVAPGVRSGAPRVVLVDRKDAPQSVITVIRDGVAAGDPRAPLLDLVNGALGGSFTSRLNQNLREDHNWTYGASSSFVELRGQGVFFAKAAVVTEATGPALKEMLGELSKMAASGLTDEEFTKVKAQDRAELVQSYEAVGGIAGRLGSLAILGLPPGYDAQASQARQRASVGELAKLAAAVDPKTATVVVVGPAAAVTPQLSAIGLEVTEVWDPEGFPLKGAVKAAVKP
jgi:zinc protease